MESIGNTTIQTLEAAGSSDIDADVHIFKGTPQITTGYSYIYTIITASGSGTLNVKQSMDADVWDKVDTYTYPGDLTAGDAQFKITQAKALYVMVEFVNTANVDNEIRLQTVLRADSSEITGPVGITGPVSITGYVLVTDEPETAITRDLVTDSSWYTGTFSADTRGREGWWGKTTVTIYKLNTGDSGFSTSILRGAYVLVSLEDTTVLGNLTDKLIISVNTLNTINNINVQETYVYRNTVLASPTINESSIRYSELIMLYFGNIPLDIHPEIKRFPLLLVGSIPTGDVTYIKFECTSGGNFLIKYSGYYQDTYVGNIETRYISGTARISENNLSSLSVTNGSLKTIITDPVSITGYVQVTDESEREIIRDLVTDSTWYTGTFSADTRGREGWWGKTTVTIYKLNTGDDGFPTSILRGAYVLVSLEDTTVLINLIDKLTIRVNTKNNLNIEETYVYRNTLAASPSISNNTVRYSELIMLYFGNIALDIHPGIKRFPLLLVGSIPTSQVISIKFECTSGGNFLIKHSGYYYDNYVGNIETRYLSEKARMAETNLSSLTVTNGSLNTRIQDSGSNAFTSTVIASKRGLDVNIMTNPQGNVYGNVCSGVTIAGNTLSTAFNWVAGTYGQRSVLSYKDASTVTDSISIFTSSSSGGTPNDIYLGSAFPTTVGNLSGRYYCFILNLSSFTSIAIRNNSTSAITGVYATLAST